MAKVVPGDKLGVEEEFLPASGTYLEDGNISAANIGDPSFENNQISVSNKIKVFVDDLLKQNKRVEVIGMVEVIMEQIAFVSVTPINKNIVLPGKDAILHISNVDSGYVETMREKIRIGDIVKAQVIKLEPGRSVISLIGPYGVLEAFCTKCRSKLLNLGFQRGSNMMGCPVCTHKETRKMAKVI